MNLRMNLLAAHICAHPKAALITGISGLTLAEFLHEATIPPIIMQGFQVLAWAVTITVGLITIVGAVRKRFRKDD